MKALVIGATGAVGTEIVQQLLDDNRFTKVDIFVRRNIDFYHPKLTIHQIDFDNPSQWRDLVKGDVCYSCLGCSAREACSKEEQRKVDFNYQLLFAEIACQNYVGRYILLSCSGVTAKSKGFLKIKWDLEEAVKGLNFGQLQIFHAPKLERPDGAKKDGLFTKLGLAKKETLLPTPMLAAAMIKASKRVLIGEFIIEPPEIWSLASRPDYL